MVIGEEAIRLRMRMRRWTRIRRDGFGRGLHLLRKHTFALPPLLAGVFAFLCWLGGALIGIGIGHVPLVLIALALERRPCGKLDRVRI